MATGYSVSDLRVDEERFRASFEALARLGQIAGGGVHRPAFSPAHLQARSWFHEQAERAGLEVWVDGAGNHSAQLRSGQVTARTLLLGSHLDSVPNGGRFDGALGVLCALEVLQAVQQSGISLDVNLEAIDFTDEEGAYVGLLGSRALAGKLRPEDLESSPGTAEAFIDALERSGLTKSSILSASRAPTSLAGYLEVHIEQGLRLAESGVDIGIVTSMVGITRYRLKFLGRADHAGTTPMRGRRDASQGASAFALVARDMVMQEYRGCVVNVGNMAFEPGVFNVVPAAVDVSLEFRSSDDEQLQRLESALVKQAYEQAKHFGLELQVERAESIAPAPMSAAVQRIIEESSRALGLRHKSLASGAGHDAQSLATLCPTGMIFVPSVGGHSHSPKELTRWRDCVNGANVLLQGVLRMVGVGQAG
jgi:N-carbamoyl-L-amino-acid hydrolase